MIKWRRAIRSYNAYIADVWHNVGQKSSFWDITLGLAPPMYVSVNQILKGSSAVRRRGDVERRHSSERRRIADDLTWTAANVLLGIEYCALE